VVCQLREQLGVQGQLFAPVGFVHPGDGVKLRCVEIQAGPVQIRVSRAYTGRRVSRAMCMKKSCLLTL
jgi:hypothetical protein